MSLWCGDQVDARLQADDTDGGLPFHIKLSFYEATTRQGLLSTYSDRVFWETWVIPMRLVSPGNIGAQLNQCPSVRITACRGPWHAALERTPEQQPQSREARRTGACR